MWVFVSRFVSFSFFFVLWFFGALSGWGVAQWGRFGRVSRHLLVCRPAGKEGEEREERREG